MYSPALNLGEREEKSFQHIGLGKKLMAEAEKILLEEQPLLPLYERSTIYTQSSRLTGVGRRSAGFDPDFTTATIRN